MYLDLFSWIDSLVRGRKSRCMAGACVSGPLTGVTLSASAETSYIALGGKA